MTNINELLREANELVPRINFDDASALIDDPNTIILDVREGQELRESGKIKIRPAANGFCRYLGNGDAATYDQE